VRARLKQFEAGRFGELLKSARQAAERARQGGRRGQMAQEQGAEEEGILRRVLSTMRRSGPCKKALAPLEQGLGIASGEAAMRAAAELHPRGPLPTEMGETADAPHVSPEDVYAAARSFPRETAPGRGGLRPEHFREAMDTPGRLGVQVREAFAEMTNAALRGDMHPAIGEEGELVLLEKPSGGYRPIVLLSALRRLISKCALRAERDGIQGYMAEVHQYGVGCPGGVDRVAAVAVKMVEEGAVLYSIDFKNAFNSIDREVAYEAVKEQFPGLAKYAFALLSKPLTLHVRGGGGDTVQATRGGPQGDPFSPFLFAMALAKMRSSLDARAAREGFAFHDLWYVDDGIVALTGSANGTLRRR